MALPGPAQSKFREINRHDRGRGVYFECPSGHFLENHYPALWQQWLAALPRGSERGAVHRSPLLAAGAVGPPLVVNSAHLTPRGARVVLTWQRRCSAAGESLPPTPETLNACGIGAISVV